MAEVAHDSVAAVDFLRRWDAVGPWLLTAIVPDARVESRSFRPEDHEHARRWIEDRQGRCNLYFSVNRPLRALPEKATKDDIGWMLALHVDVDPRAGEDFAEERARILKKVESFKPLPSVVIDSGGGYQAFWLLKEAVKVADVARLEAYNKQMEIVFGGDHCWNIDRIMRLPGTVNVPNKKKVKKGRTATLARLHRADWALRYELTDFLAAPMAASRDSNERVDISGNLGRVELDDLPREVPDWVKMVILHGDDPIDRTRYNGDRSKAVFGVTCALVRAGCSDDQVASILMDEGYPISGHVRAQGRVERYVERQIARAKEAAISPELEELNRQFCIINEGGKTRILSRERDEIVGRDRITRWSFEDFKNFLIKRRIQVGVDDKGAPVYAPLANWWLKHPRGRIYRRVVFAPNREEPEAYNLWQGFGCEAVPGDWTMLREHVRDVICAGNREHFDYLLGWMARAVQKPDEQGQVATVLKGERGIGKGIFAHAFGSLFGHHYLAVSNSKHITGNFNAHLRDVVLLFADEAFWAGDKQGESTLKTLITEPTLALEAKGVDVVAARNYIHLLISSNNDWVIPAGHDERRYFVMEVSPSRKKDFDHFGRLDEHAKLPSTRAAMLHDLLRHDLSAYQVRRVPATDALREQKVRSFSPEMKWWHDILDAGRLLRKHDRWLQEVSCDRLQDDYVSALQRVGQMHRASATELGMFLRKVLPDGWPKRERKTITVDELDDHGHAQSVRRRVMVYALPALADCRKHFDRFTESKHPWSEEVTD